MIRWRFTFSCKIVFLLSSLREAVGFVLNYLATSGEGFLAVWFPLIPNSYLILYPLDFKTSVFLCGGGTIWSFVCETPIGFTCSQDQCQYIYEISFEEVEVLLPLSPKFPLSQVFPLPMTMWDKCFWVLTSFSVKLLRGLDCALKWLSVGHCRAVILYID